MLNRVAGRTIIQPTKQTAPSAPKQAGESRFSLYPGAKKQSPAPPGSPPSALGSAVRATMNRLEQQRTAIDGVIRRAARGATFSPAELLVLQSRVYTYSRELELVSRLVDRTVSSVKTTLNTQV